MMNPKLMAQALRQMGMQSHPKDSVLAYITPGQERQLEMQDGHPGQIDPITGLVHNDDSSSSGDGTSGGSTSDSDNGYGGSGAQGDNQSGDFTSDPDTSNTPGALGTDAWSGLGPNDPSSDAIDAAFAAAKNGPEYDENRGDLGTTGRGGAAGLGPGAIDALDNEWSQDPSAFENAHNQGFNGGFTWGFSGKDAIGGAKTGYTLGNVPGAIIGAGLGGLWGGSSYNPGDPGWATPGGTDQSGTHGEGGNGGVGSGGWGGSGAEDSGSSGQDGADIYYINDPEIGGTKNTAATPTNTYAKPTGGYTHAGYSSSTPAAVIAALRGNTNSQGPNYVTTHLDMTPLQGVRRRGA